MRCCKVEDIFSQAGFEWKRDLTNMISIEMDGTLFTRK